MREGEGEGKLKVLVFPLFQPKQEVSFGVLIKEFEVLNVEFSG